jgi:hypothetical protein
VHSPGNHREIAMSPFRAGRKVLLATLTTAVCVILPGLAAHAAEAPVRDETTLLVRTSAGQVERLRIDGELAVGEIRAVTTESGNPARLSRDATGTMLELAGEDFEIDLPAVGTLDEHLAALDAGAGGSDAEGKRIVIHSHLDHADGAATAPAGQRKIVRVVHHGADGEIEIDPADPMLTPESAILEGEGPKVIVMRKLVRGPVAD